MTKLRQQKGYKPKIKIIGILQEISQMNKFIDCDSLLKNELDEIKNWHWRAMVNQFENSTHTFQVNANRTIKNLKKIFLKILVTTNS